MLYPLIFSVFQKIVQMKKPDETQTEDGKPAPEKPKCGIVMPIAEIDGLSANHWIDVKLVLAEAIEAAGFMPRLVSNSDEVQVIQKTIVQNLYDDEIIVCDVSARNPNVMFELGMRLAFDKPAVIVMDDKTSFTFDMGIIEHLLYPRDLRYSKINQFKEDLQAKIENTVKASKTKPGYSPFLKHFTEIKAAKVASKELPQGDFIVETLRHMQTQLSNLQVSQNRIFNANTGRPGAVYRVTIELDTMSTADIQVLTREVLSPFGKEVSYTAKTVNGMVLLQLHSSNVSLVDEAISRLKISSYSQLIRNVSPIMMINT
jgi:hypothetical protein